MKQNNAKWMKIVGWTLLVFAIGLFCLQMGYLVIHERLQVEFADNRLFYLINICCIIFLLLAVLLLLQLTKRFKAAGSVIAAIFIFTQVILLGISNQEIRNIVSVSPDMKHVLSIKENLEHGEAVYYRTYYGILARPKERLPHKTDGKFQVKWLADDVAAVTYKAADNTIQQYIGTYGDRGSGISYYYVGAEIHGKWQGDNIEVVSNTEGISVTENGETELFEWDNIDQFGTLAVVLKKNNAAVWSLSLDKNFEVDSDSANPAAGNISLYKADMEGNQPTTLDFIAPN